MRNASWANVGTSVEGTKTVEEVLQKARLDYVVETMPVQVGAEGYVIPNKFATVTRLETGDVERSFGVVGSAYTICQNRDAFDFVNYINGDLEFVKAGETGKGLIYIIARLPEQFVLGDKMRPFVIFQNGHNGVIPIRAAITPLRIACQNQFNLSFKQADNTINIRHSSTLVDRMDTAKQVLRQTADYMDTFRIEAEKLATIRIPNFKETEIIQELFPTNNEKSENYNENQLIKQQRFLTAYKEEDNQNFKGTVWGMVNAYADYTTHELPGRETDNWQENRFTKVTMDPKAMQAFIKLVNAYV